MLPHVAELDPGLMRANNDLFDNPQGCCDNRPVVLPVMMFRKT